MSEKPDFYDRVQPLITQFAISLQEEHGLSVDEVGNSLMSAGIAIAVGVSGKEATVVALGAIAKAVASGRYDGAVEMTTLS